MAEHETTPLLEVAGLNAYYGSAQALEDVSFAMGRESVAVVGRNGMGKTTLCNAIMGISPPRAEGSIRFEGEELVGVAVAQDRAHGDRLRPAGPPALPVADGRRAPHESRLAGHRANGHASGRRERVYELFPRLAERKRNGGAQLSGGEQQMLAIGRALVTNPKILVMDEPSEGLAPTVIEGLIETFQLLEEEGLAILLIEQNLGVATALAERQLVMIGGRIAAETTAARARERSRAAAPVPRRRAARTLGFASPLPCRSSSLCACRRSRWSLRRRSWPRCVRRRG